MGTGLRFLVVVGMSLIGAVNYASAQSKSNKPSKSRPAKVESEVPASIGGRFSVSLYCSFADQVHYEGKADLFSGPTRFTATDQTTSSLGISASYFFRREWSFGYEGALAYDMPRSSNGLTADVGGTQLQGQYVGDPKISVAAVSANANYSVGTSAYIFAGANYPLVMTKTDGADLNGLLGYQAGLGYAATDRLLFEIAYREIKMDGVVKSGNLVLKVREATFPGPLLSIRVLF